MFFLHTCYTLWYGNVCCDVNAFIYNFQQRISWLSHRWRTQRNAISNVNCRIQWIIESLNAPCAPWYSEEHACLSVIKFSTHEPLWAYCRCWSLEAFLSAHPLSAPLKCISLVLYRSASGVIVMFTPLTVKCVSGPASNLWSPWRWLFLTSDLKSGRTTRWT